MSIHEWKYENVPELREITTKSLIWDEIKKHLNPVEYDEICKKIGVKTIEDNEVWEKFIS